MTPTTDPDHSGLFRRQRVTVQDDLRHLANTQGGLFHGTVRKVIHRHLGPRTGHGAVMAWTAVATAALLSTTGPVDQGYRQLARRHHVSERALSRGRAKLMPPTGPGGVKSPPTTDAVLLRQYRGRRDVNTGVVKVSRWYAGDRLLLEVQRIMRAVLERPPRRVAKGRAAPRTRPAGTDTPRSVEPDTTSANAAPAPGQAAGRALYATWKADRPPPKRR